MKEPLYFSWLHAFSPGITQQKAVNMQSRLISFPRSPVQKRASCVNKSVVYISWNVICLQMNEYLQIHKVFIDICSGVNKALCEASFGQKYFYLIHGLEKPQGLELLEHLSSGGFNRRVYALHLKVHSSFVSRPKNPVQTNKLCVLTQDEAY